MSAGAPRDCGSRYWVSGYPELVAEWDHERNGALTPDEVSAGSARMIWWRCARGDDHRWRAKPNNRTAGTECPFCTNRRVSSTNSLARRFPAIAAEWHPTRNGGATPADVVATSSRRCWWRCTRNGEHEWCAVVRDRTRFFNACPWCAGKRASETTSLAARRPALAAEWHPSKNGSLRACDVTVGSNRRVHWRCAANAEHEWCATVANRALRASGCPRCASRAVR